MNFAVANHHWNLRRARADAILAEPYLYKVCTQCAGIARQMAAICPACHAYRFDHLVTTLVDSCEHMIEVPFPVTSGTVPRLKYDPLTAFTPPKQIEII